MKKAKILTIFIFAIFIAVINILSLKSQPLNNINYINSKILNSNKYPSVLVKNFQQTGEGKAEAIVSLIKEDELNITPVSARVFLNNSQLDSKFVKVDGGINPFSNKHFTITGLKCAKLSFKFVLDFDDVKDDNSHYCIQSENTLTITKWKTVPLKKNLAAIIVPSVIVPLVVISIAGGIYYYIDSKKKQKKLEKTDIQKMTIND